MSVSFHVDIDRSGVKSSRAQRGSDGKSFVEESNFRDWRFCHVERAALIVKYGEVGGRKPSRMAVRVFCSEYSTRAHSLWVQRWSS